MLIEAEAVLFDLDGTLVDSTASVARSWARWSHEFDVTAEQFAAVHAHGRPARDLVADLVPAGVTGQAVARIERLEIDDAADVVALPGAAQALAATAGRSAIVTSCTGPLALARIAAAGLDAPAVLVTADDVRRGKPDPEPFLLAADRLGVHPRRALAVEDAPAGIAAARAAGCRVLAVATTHSHDELDGDLVVPSLEWTAWAVQGGFVQVTERPS